MAFRHLLIIALIAVSFDLLAAERFVKVQQGTLEGVNAPGHIVFKGVPYAKPPVGRLRWRAPQPPEKFKGLYVADTYGPMSLQVKPSLNGIAGGKQVIGSEDSLYLNIWVPKNARSKKLPVMFWIHGGAYVLGAGAQEIGKVNLYDGARMAERGEVIVVSHNYRLGAMGFFAHEDLARETATGSTGNYGLLDHIAALRWVKNNIAQFGGDPKSITIFGESAGGASVFALIASPRAKGLFSGAIAQSAPFMHNQLNEHIAMGDHFVESYGLEKDPKKMDRLREVSGKEIALNFQMSGVDRHPDDPLIKYGYVVDGDFDKEGKKNPVLKYSVLETIVRGEHNKVPVIVGTNQHEMTVLQGAFLSGMPRNAKRSDFINAVSSFFNKEMAQQLLKKYPAKQHGGYKNALIAAMGDVLFHGPAKQVADAMEAHRPGSVYKYVYSKEVLKFKAGHATEVPYIFGTEYMLLPLTLEYGKILTNVAQSFQFGKTLENLSKTGDIVRDKMQSEKAFSNMMIDYWTNFAYEGRPSRVGGNPNELSIEWPAYKTGLTINLDTKPRLFEGFRRHYVDYVDQVTRSFYVRPLSCKALF